MTLLLIRHGETELNAGRVVQFPDTPLGANGIEQALRLGRHLGTRNIGLVLSSDYRRARMTAASVVAHTGAPMLEHASLRERNFGDFRGSAYAEHGVDIMAPDFVPPNGEGWAAFHARVDQAWQLIQDHAAKVEGDLAVVTHGLVLRSLIERKLMLGDCILTPDLVVHNTSVTLVERGAPWRLRELASIAHLDDAQAGGIA
ncbi:MAG: histidine phosphatase family protein [Proteobacteria bacterium]|nr:histidine phosphatase family protein [Pseudomonadota bacterium]